MVSKSLECHVVMKPKRSSCSFSFLPGDRTAFHLDDHLAIELKACFGSWVQSIPAVHELGGVNTAVKRGNCSGGRKFRKLNL